MVKTGKAPIGLMTYLSIMSISLIVNLPGLAVAPMEGKLKEILNAPELEVQLLTTLPNFIIIPFVLLSGKLSEARHKIPIIVSALALYAGCAVWYLFADSMGLLILISCLLGCGAGLLIPFSTGLIANTFDGKYRMKQMGWQSGISNTTVVLATFAVGWLIQGKNWHLPFIVYLAAGIPLIFSMWLKTVPGISAKDQMKDEDIEPLPDPAIDASNNPPVIPTGNNVSDNSSPAASKVSSGKQKSFSIGRIWGLIGVYFFITFTSIAITNYVSQLVEQYHWDPDVGGTVTAVFFLFVLIPGYVLTFFVKFLRDNTFFWTAFMMLIGLGLFVFIPQEWAMYAGAAFTGLGYGICQPMLYDKASYTVTNPNKITLALAFVLTANYLAIAVQPFIISALGDLFRVHDINLFAFGLSFALVIGYTLITFLLRKKFAFTVDKSYYE